jgi:hypothetical protein
MSIVSQLLIPTTFLLSFVSQSWAQTCKPPDEFQGHWQWALYAQSKSELPPALRDMDLKDVPRYSLTLDLEEKGETLTGRYAATANFLTKIEDGSFATPVKTKAVRVNLESTFGGKVTVELTLEGNELYWTIMVAEGEHYFPVEVVLERHPESSMELAEVLHCP